MGAAALAGTSFKLDRNSIVSLLGFKELMENSLDAVGSRDFVLEALCICSLIASDLSRIAQDLIFYSSTEVGLVALPDEFTSTSSIMPQKKNPDPLELVRAKCGRIAGNLTGALAILHGLPSGYNLDFQEITPLLWQSIGELKSCLRVVTRLILRIEINKYVTARPYLQFTAATEIANVLVREEGIQFRLAHRVVGSAVRDALQQSKSLKDISKNDWEGYLRRKIKARTIYLIARALDLRKLLLAYQTKGSPNPKEMRNVILRRKKECRSLRKESMRCHKEIHEAVQTLAKAVTEV
jgi:argininosuccinate lyase